ncbi:unnamed protein product [Closterium sp. Yama58-4]|nr:unnamed protein product [Closterium sp. Yama58-4]
MQGTVGSSKGQESESWLLGFLKDCAQLQELNLGRGMWKLNWQCVNTAWFKTIRKLTLEQVHYGSMSFQFLEIITRQLHEFTLYEDGNVHREYSHEASTSHLAFSFPSARLLRFRFASTELHLTLTVPPSLETLSVVAKRLVLSCESTAPLALHHLSLYGQEQLVISSLRLASARVVYLDGPANDQEGFSWTEWLDIIAPTVEVLIVRHGVPIKKVEAEWGRLLRLGIVVPPWDKDTRANSWSTGYGTDDESECEEHLDDGRLRFSWADEPAINAKIRDRERLLKAFFKPPSIRAPNLRFLFFPTRKACNAPATGCTAAGLPRPGALLCGGPLLLLGEEGGACEQCAARACEDGQEWGLG